MLWEGYKSLTLLIFSLVLFYIYIYKCSDILLFHSQSWLVAYRRRGFAQVDPIHDHPDHILFLRRFITMNYISSYVY